MPKKYGLKEKDLVVSHILNLVLTGKLRTGDRVDRNEIAVGLGVSRVPIKRHWSSWNTMASCRPAITAAHSSNGSMRPLSSSITSSTGCSTASHRRVRRPTQRLG